MHRIQELGETEHKEIFNILSAGGIDHTRNSNGVFLNLTTVPDELVRTVHQFVTFCHSNKASLDEYDKLLNECKYSHHHNGYAYKPTDGEETGGDEAPLSSVAGNVEDAFSAEFSRGELSPQIPQQASCEPTAGAADGSPPGNVATQLPASVALADAGRLWDAASLDKKAENAKFAQAKKKYAKRRVPDKKADALSDLTSNTLKPEPYPMIDRVL
jgi:hypothetical protein